MRIASMTAFMLAVTGCGDNAELTDARIKPDVATETPSDATRCGADRLLIGDFLDWDSTAANVTGIYSATLTVEGEPMRTTMTALNGRFELCVQDAASVKVQIDSPVPYHDAIAYIERDAIQGLATHSLRGFTTDRATSFYSSRGLTYSSGAAHVLVLLTGDIGEVTLDATHDAVQAANDSATKGTFVWSAGNAGRYILFPNVSVLHPTALLTGDLSGAHTIPLSANRLTLVAVSWVSL